LVSTLRAKLKELSSAYVRAGIGRREGELVSKGVPRETAFAVASFDALFGAGDILYLAMESNVSVEIAARAHALIGEATGIEKLFSIAIHLTSSDHWERLAIRRIVEDFTQQQAVLASIALKAVKSGPGGIEAVETWLATNSAYVKSVASALEELEGGTGLTAARLSLAVGHVRDLVTSARTQQRA
jgi:glutamate dehydrogenase